MTKKVLIKQDVAESKNEVIDDVEQIIEQSREFAYHAVNVSLVYRNWLIGKRIVEEELKESRKENYGLEIIKSLSKAIEKKHGKGFSRTSLYQYYSFYRLYPNIFQPPAGQSFLKEKTDGHEIVWPPARKSFPKEKEYVVEIVSSATIRSFLHNVEKNVLSWSHYVELISVVDVRAREWYEKECITQRWSKRTLRRNITSQYYYRVLSTGNKQQEKSEPETPYERKLDFVKNPVILEYLEVSPNEKLYESKLETLLITNLRSTLLELGKGYAFVGRQYNIHTDARDYYIDLVFYNYILNCFVLIDLKTERITHQDVGQMDMYVRMFDELVKGEKDNPTLGIVLCAETDEDIARYSILKGNEQLFATKYKLYLPDEAELKAEIEHQKELFYLQQNHGK